MITEATEGFGFNLYYLCSNFENFVKNEECISPRSRGTQGENIEIYLKRINESLWPLLAAHNAACLAGESPAPAIDCMAG